MSTLNSEIIKAKINISTNARKILLINEMLFTYNAKRCRNARKIPINSNLTISIEDILPFNKDEIRPMIKNIPE